MATSSTKKKKLKKYTRNRVPGTAAIGKTQTPSTFRGKIAIKRILKHGLRTRKRSGVLAKIMRSSNLMHSPEPASNERQPVAEQASLVARSSIPLGSSGTLMENILPSTGTQDDILTSEDPDVDFDPSSMVPSRKEEENLDARLKAAIADLDQIIEESHRQVENTPSSDVATNKLKSRIMMKFVLQISSKQSFVYEAELRHTTFYQNRLTYKFIMPLSDALRLNSIYYRTTANVNVKTQNYGVRLTDVSVMTRWSDGRVDDPVDWPLKLSKKSKTGTYRMAGVEIKKASRLKPENVIAVITFSFNGW